MRLLVGGRCNFFIALLVLALGVAAIAWRSNPDAGSLDAKDYSARVDKILAAVRAGDSSITFGSLTSMTAFIEDMKKVGHRDDSYIDWMTQRVEDLLVAAEQGKDLLAQEKGFIWRGYRSRYSYRPQIYSAYIPKDYDPAEPKPLIITLHGGSSNHNLWLALNLGNKVSVSKYWDNHRTRFRAKRHPGAIVVSPNGLGQVRWRWAGEQDVLDVIDDVRANYNIDEDKIFLSGLSNGGIGAYTIGLKHASRFAGVFPLAGVTDWLSHHEADGRLRSCERNVLRNESAITYASNAANTSLRFFHGDKDPGFSVEQARKMADRLKALKIPFKFHEFENQGHDLGYVLWRKLLIMHYVRKYTRDPAPRKVSLVTASARANKQEWLLLDDRIDHAKTGELQADAGEDGTIRVTTRNVQRFSILLDESPAVSPVTVYVDRQVAYRGPVPQDNRLTLSLAFAPVKSYTAGELNSQPLWANWDGAVPEPGTRKVDGLSGPMGDANYESQVHVYGTQVKEDTRSLKKAAQLGARGWMMAWDYTEIRHRVIPDTELTWEMMRNNAIFLYGNARNNSILAEVGEQLPIQVVDKHMVIRGKKVSGWGVGARFICPNPLAPQRYLVVATGSTASAVEAGGRLPIYMADYLVYHHLTTKRKAFMILGGRKEIETGYFTEDWKLPERPPPG